MESTESVVHAPLRTFSRVTVKDIRSAQMSREQICRKYDLHPIEAKLLTEAQMVDEFGRIGGA